ncbi:type II secretion system protein GspD [candidate division KSB1 bacterium]|nr:type II secretion system protein GspD [candidate division KSB1 bacterium]
MMLVLLLSLFSIIAPFSFAQSDSTDFQNTEDQYQDQPVISNVFYETDLRQAIQDIAAQAEVMIVADNTVQGFVTMEIVDLPLELALKRILSIGGYTFRKMDGYYLVGAAEPSNPSFGLLCTTESVPINYLPAETASQLLSDFYRPYIKLNDVSNAIVVSGSPEIIESIKHNLKFIDCPPKQVMINALVTEIKDNDLKSIGLDWRLTGQKSNASLRAGNNLSIGLIDTLNALFSIFRTETGILANKNIAGDLVTSLNALFTSDKLKVKANPSIVTTNAQPATIYIAKEQFFSVVTGPLNYPYTKLEKVSVGIRLEITPYVSENGEITVKIAPEVSDAVGYGREGLPLVDRRSVTTTVRVKNEQTIVIGGLTQENNQKIQNKIPLLGSIPILGYLFSHTKYVKQKTDIVVFVTPRIIKEN